MPVRKSNYRQPMTPHGINHMENGTLNYFDDESWANLNTGTLEQYFNEKTRQEGFKNSVWNWKHVIFGILVGLAFALINQYVGLKVGMIIGAGWYVVYLTGMFMKWDPTDINISAGASTGTSATCTGFVFSFPAVYLLAKSMNYTIGTDANGNPLFLVAESQIPSIWMLALAATLAGFLGIMYFNIFRRIWLVEDPLPVPGFQASLKLMDIAHDLGEGNVEHAKRSINSVLKWTSITGFFVFLRDFPVFGQGDDKISILQKGFGGKVYSHGEVMIPYDHYTHIGFEIIPIQLAFGWFVKLRTALLVNLGTLLVWFVIIPMAVYFEYPVYDYGGDVYYNIATMPMAAWVAYSSVARIMAIGAILSAGILGLVKMGPAFKSATSDIFAIGGGEQERTDYVPDKGWFEWPMTQIPVMAVLLIIGITLAFTIGGMPTPQSLVFTIVLALSSLILGAICIKVMGEVGTTPVSGTSFIVLLMLYMIFKAMGTETSTMVILMVIGTSIFGTTLSLSSDIIYDFKIGMYTGTRPYHLMRGELTGIVFGAPVAVLGATLFSIGLTELNSAGQPLLPLAAPQANAFAETIRMLLAKNPAWDLFFIGCIIGVVAELTTGMGTAFGLGMYLPLPINLPLIAGGAARDWWEKNRLEPRAKAENWDEKEKTLVVINTYMIATGLILGEALIGTIVAFYYIVPLFMG